MFYGVDFLLLLACVLLSACSFYPTTATPKASNKPTPTPVPNEGQIAQAVFNAINQDRTAAGLPALTWSTGLATSAHQHNLAMQAANNLAHQLPNEADFGARERQQKIQWNWAAENIGETTEQTQAGALALHAAMMAEKPPEDGHRQNILTKNGTLLGVDILINKQNHELWLTEDFAKV